MHCALAYFALVRALDNPCSPIHPSTSETLPCGEEGDVLCGTTPVWQHTNGTGLMNGINTAQPSVGHPLLEDTPL